MIEIPADIEGLVFDCDGTIADTMPLHYEGWVEAIQHHGGEFPEALFYEMAGIPTARIIELLNERHGWNIPVQEAAEFKEKLYIERIHRVLPIEPVVQIVEDYAGKLPMAVATGGTRAICTKTLSGMNVLHHFQAIVTADDVEHGKPAPDIFLEAAKRLGVKPEKCYAFEDGELGLQSARAAGMVAIDVRPMYSRAPEKRLDTQGKGAKMDTLASLIRWFSGGENQYMQLAGCMKHDTLWIAITVCLDFSVALGYVLIALHWWRNQKHLPDVPAKRALAHMRNIFLFCGICGYIFIPIKMLWPAWRLYDCFMAFLVYFTWRYALRTRELKVVYSELGRSNQLAAELEESREQAHRKNEFLNAVSHDLRTPLNGMVLQSSVAEFSLKANDVEGAQKALTEIRESTAAVANLLDSLLEYARLDMHGEQNTCCQFDLTVTLKEICSRSRAHAERKQIQLKSENRHEQFIYTDRLKLDRVLSNLVDNAIKFTKSGGVRIETEQAGANIEIHVIDTGIGIESAVQNRLFEEFFQVDNHERDRSKGFGMGLSIARRLARQLGGDISVDSAPGRGSRFSICLPGVVQRQQTLAQPVPATV